MGSPAIEIVELGKLVHGIIEHLVTRRDEIGIARPLAKVDGRDSKKSRDMVVVDVSDRVLGVVVEVQGLLKQLNSSR